MIAFRIRKIVIAANYFCEILLEFCNHNGFKDHFGFCFQGLKKIST